MLSHFPKQPNLASPWLLAPPAAYLTLEEILPALSLMQIDLKAPLLSPPQITPLPKPAHALCPQSILTLLPSSNTGHLIRGQIPWVLGLFSCFPKALLSESLPVFHSHHLHVF